MKTLMKTMTGMMMMMIMTAAQKREELLWTTVFALQVSSVVEKVFNTCFIVKCKLFILSSVAVGSSRTYQSIYL